MLYIRVRLNFPSVKFRQSPKLLVLFKKIVYGYKNGITLKNV